MEKRVSVTANRIAWCVQVLAALIFAQTLYFKFLGAEESMFIFRSLGVEPWGRIAAGVAELIAAGLLLTPKTHWMGAAWGLAIISGAIASHLFVLGIVVQDDGGLLFGLAVVEAVACGVILYLRRGAWLPFLRRDLQVVR